MRGPQTTKNAVRMECEFNNISEVFSIKPKFRQTQLFQLPPSVPCLPGFMFGNHLTSNILYPAQGNGFVMNGHFPNLHISNKNTMIQRQHNQIKARPRPIQPKKSIFGKSWHKPGVYIPVEREKKNHDNITKSEKIRPDVEQKAKNLKNEDTKRTPPSKKFKLSLDKGVTPKCNKQAFVAALALTSIKPVKKQSVWLNVTLQVDTSSEMKLGQPIPQYRSLITTVVTDFYYPHKLAVPEEILQDQMKATASYDERGRLTILRVEFITAGIYQVDSEEEKVIGKPCCKPIKLTRLESLETFSPKSQYLLLGDLCPVPKAFNKCHRNAKTLCKKVSEFLYSREFRKYTLPLLAEAGEEDVWTSSLKAPRTRSRASEYDDDTFNKLFEKRKAPSSSETVMEKEEDNLPKKRRRCGRGLSSTDTTSSEPETTNKYCLRSSSRIAAQKSSASVSQQKGLPTRASVSCPLSDTPKKCRGSVDPQPSFPADQSSEKIPNSTAKTQQPDANEGQPVERDSPVVSTPEAFLANFKVTTERSSSDEPVFVQEKKTSSGQYGSPIVEKDQDASCLFFVPQSTVSTHEKQLSFPPFEQPLPRGSTHTECSIIQKDEDTPSDRHTIKTRRTSSGKINQIALNLLSKQIPSPVITESLGYKRQCTDYYHNSPSVKRIDSVHMNGFVDSLTQQSEGTDNTTVSQVPALPSHGDQRVGIQCSTRLSTYSPKPNPGISDFYFVEFSTPECLISKTNSRPSSNFSCPQADSASSRPSSNCSYDSKMPVVDLPNLSLGDELCIPLDLTNTPIFTLDNLPLDLSCKKR